MVKFEFKVDEKFVFEVYICIFVYGECVVVCEMGVFVGCYGNVFYYYCSVGFRFVF